MIPLTAAEKLEMIHLDQERQRRIAENRLVSYSPYPKQLQFHCNGKTYRERLLRAGNQCGKTVAGGAEVAMHLTGIYPDWWQGKRYNRAVRWMAGSESAELTRKGVQRVMVGTPEDRSAWGTGWIPKKSLLDWSMRSGVADAIASLTVRHISGSVSTLQFASYEQGRAKWQSDTLDGVWFDEEPPEDVYSEGITRTNVGMGPVILTATLLSGMTDVVRRFIGSDSPDRSDTVMTIHDVGHYSDSERQRIIASYPLHERDARTLGIPSAGSGRIFPVADNMITVPAFEIPRHWPQIGGLDFGYDHPTAGARLAWDRDTDTIYLTAEYKRRGQDITGVAPTVAHASALKPWGAWLPWSWPHDGLQHDKGAGEQLQQQFADQGLKMLPDKATFPPQHGEKEGTGGNSVEAGIQDMLDRMESGRWKVFDHCTLWMEEFRLYHREKGRVVKEFDDLISASRYAMMMLRFAGTSQKKKPKSANEILANHSYGGW